MFSFFHERSWRRWVTAGGLLALVLGAGSSGAFAQDNSALTPTANTPTPTATATTAPVAFAAGDPIRVADGPLNLRSDSAIDAEIVETLPTASLLWVTGAPVTADGHAWVPVFSPSTGAGWVAGEFLAANAAGPFDLAEPVYVHDGPLNVRSEAGLDADIVTTAELGATLELVSGPTKVGELSWYEVKVDASTTGWVAGLYLTDDQADLAPAGFVEGDEVVVIDGALNLRAAAGLEADIVTVLPDAAPLTIGAGDSQTLDGFTWYPVMSADAGEGWVAGEFLAAAA
jgi:hypothetical protein